MTTPTADNLLKGATPLPWTLVELICGNRKSENYGLPYFAVKQADQFLDEDLPEGDARLIVFAVNNLPAHLAELKALRAENERLTKERNHLKATLLVLGGKPDSANGHYSVKDVLALLIRFARAKATGTSIEGDEGQVAMAEILAEIDTTIFSKRCKL